MIVYWKQHSGPEGLILNEDNAVIGNAHQRFTGGSTDLMSDF